jgi:succinate dehydrogenase/fumarate reductase flavoprotein subunit
VIVEKMPADRAGGNSRVSSGAWLCPHDVELAKTYFRELAGEFDVPVAVVDAWALETSRNTSWIRQRLQEARGRVRRDEADPYSAEATDITSLAHGDVMKLVGWADAPHYEFYEIVGSECGTEFNFIGPSLGYSRLWYTLKECVDLRGIRVLYDAPANCLVCGEDGRIEGIVARPSADEPITISARKAVILATGGFAASDEMARNYLRLSYVTPWGSPANTGDGIRMAQKMGADLAHPYNYMGHPGMRLPPYEAGEQTQPAGPSFINVGADGRRFMDETTPSRHGKAWMRGFYDFYPGVPMWTVFDEDARLAGPLTMTRETCAVGWMKQIERYDWSDDNSAEIERGWITRASSIPELAEALEIEPAGLEDEVERYNALATAGQGDPVFGRPAPTMSPIKRPPFYGYRWGQMLITTLGGIRKDEFARALDPYGAAIPGLYCAGDVASTYSWALGGGSGLADAMAFGRIAARHAVGLPASSEPARQARTRTAVPVQ